MDIFNILVISWSVLPIILFPFLLKIRAPYGRHVRGGWGPMVDNHWAWFWMEIPALLTFPLLAIYGPTEKDALSWVLIALWGFHYVNRVLIFPFKIQTKGKKMPISVGLMAVVFNLMNGGINGYYIGFVDGKSGVFTVLTIVGLLLFFTGFFINNMADGKLIALRKQGNGYQIPRGWLFEYISCPNHFGEIVEWFGFALVAMNPAALSFAVWTFGNLGPRAFNHHTWYKEHFKEYPKDRKVVIPGVW